MSERSAGASPSSNVSEELSALLQERERYETWIRQLEAKVDSTPRAVYDRVLADYKMRLKAVLDRVGGRTGELRTQIEALEARLSIVEKEHAELRDERAEAELRHQVGEYTSEQWKEISAHTDEALSRATAQRTDVAGDVARLREIHAAATGSDASAGERGGPADSPIAAGEGAGEPPVSREAIATKEASAKAAVKPEADTESPRAETEVPKPPVAVEPEVGKASAPATLEEKTETAGEVKSDLADAGAPRQSGAIAAAATTAPVRAEASGRAIVEEAVSASASSTSAQATNAHATNAPLTQTSSSAQAPPSAPATSTAAPSAPPQRLTPSPGVGRRTSGFDDLAFVSSLIAPDDRRPPTAPIPAAANPAPIAPADAPTPRTDRSSSAVGRPSGPETPSSFMKGVRGESVKTLKCQECGTLNYPTEWYCERCGGELAAL